MSGRRRSSRPKTRVAATKRDVLTPRCSKFQSSNATSTSVKLLSRPNSHCRGITRSTIRKKKSSVAFVRRRSACPSTRRSTSTRTRVRSPSSAARVHSLSDSVASLATIEKTAPIGHLPMISTSPPIARLITTYNSKVSKPCLACRTCCQIHSEVPSTWTLLLKTTRTGWANKIRLLLGTSTNFNRKKQTTTPTTGSKQANKFLTKMLHQTTCGWMLSITMIRVGDLWTAKSAQPTLKAEGQCFMMSRTHAPHLATPLLPP